MRLNITQTVTLSDRHIRQICEEEELDADELKDEDEAEYERLIAKYVSNHAASFISHDEPAIVEVVG